MANFNAMFAGCESFMEGDVEINNDVTVPASDGEALEAESVAEDVGTEGGEIAGEAETEDTKAEAANMVFDQLLNMYRHVKNYGIDRTFLSLYNGNGQLNSMIGYRFPSCESIDSVGSPRSQASRAFIIAMEEDGIFTRIWTWVKETAVKVYNFFIKVMDWFREACGNLDLRVGKLYKYFAEAGEKKWEDIKDKTVKYIEASAITTYGDKATKVGNELAQINGEVNNITTNSGKNLLEQISNVTTSMKNALVSTSAGIKRRAGATDASGNIKKEGSDEYAYGSDYYGRAKDKDDKDNVQQIKEYLDRVNKDLVDPLADAVSDMSFESDDLGEIKANKGYTTVKIAYGDTGVVTVSGGDDITTSKQLINTSGVVCTMLKACKDVLAKLLQQKHAMEMMNLANKQVRQQTQQQARLSGNGSMDHDAIKDLKLEMMGIVKGNSVFARITTLNEKIVAKCCTLAASLQGCVKPNGKEKEEENKPANPPA